MTVRDLREEMTYEEYCKWALYLERFPPGWREDLRTFYLLSQNSKEKMEPASVFPSLKPIFERKKTDSADIRGTLMHSKMLGAIGGDKLEFL